MSSGFYTSTIGKVLGWARSQSLWYVTTGSSCCADEVLNASGCRYDLERFGCIPATDPHQADLLIVSGSVSKKAAPHLREIYDAMAEPKYVMAVGTCANCGGLFRTDSSYSVVDGVDKIFPVDVYVPGCPPRPEAIMDGLLRLQEKMGTRSRLRDQRGTS